MASSNSKNNPSKRTLADIQLGEEAHIEAINLEGESRRRLFDLGLICGTNIKPVRTSPIGGLGAYAVRGTMIAIRREDASKIEVA